MFGGTFASSYKPLLADLRSCHPPFRPQAATEAAEAAEQSKRTSEAEAVDSLTSLVEDPFVLFAKVAEVVEANTCKLSRALNGKVPSCFDPLAGAQKLAVLFFFSRPLSRLTSPSPSS